MAPHNDPASLRLQALAGAAPKRTATVRTLARFAANSECPMAVLGFAARVDFDRLLEGTKYAVPYGQSPFAFRRGNRFEERLRENGHAPILRLLHEQLKYSTEHARVENLRNRGTMDVRAARTEKLVREIVAGKKTAPNLLDGAVLFRDVGGIRSHFEADAVAARFAGPIHAGEIKSFPTVDGQADPDGVGAAIAQVSIYILLLRELVNRVGGDSDAVSAEALLITPRNTGLQPTMTIKNVVREIERSRRILAHTPSAKEVVQDLPENLPSFERVTFAKGRSEAERIEVADQLIERVGTRYCPECLASCGFSRLCRERSNQTGDPARTGASLIRLLPHVGSVDRVYELANGAKPRTQETPVAQELVRAAAILTRAGVNPRQRKGRT
jgi:hypothetical protein